MATNKINLANFKPSNSNVFAGRPQGEAVRKELRLDKFDMTNDDFEIIIPKETTSFNPSFYLGLLFESIKILGFEKFKEKYKFSFEVTEPEMIQNLQKNLDDGLRNALNTINKNFGFDTFFN